MELEIWGRAQREAARRRKSDWGDNSDPSNATWRMQLHYPTQNVQCSFRVGKH